MELAASIPSPPASRRRLDGLKSYRKNSGELFSRLPPRERYIAQQLFNKYVTRHRGPGLTQPKQALLIPQAALQLDQSGPYVLVVGSDNKVEQQRVKLGAVEGSEIVIEQGLKQGERVIVQGIQKVHPGMVVAPAQEAPAAEATTTPQATTAAPAAGTKP